MVIQTQRREWGVRLISKPFSAPKYADMEIQVDIMGKDIKVSFLGTPYPLSRANIRTWTKALAEILQKSEAILEQE